MSRASGWLVMALLPCTFSAWACRPDNAGTHAQTIGPQAGSSPIGGVWATGSSRTYNTPAGNTPCSNNVVYFAIGYSSGWRYDTATGEWWHVNTPALGLKLTIGPLTGTQLPVVQARGQITTRNNTTLWVTTKLTRRAGAGFGQSPNPLELYMWSAADGTAFPGPGKRYAVYTTTVNGSLSTCTVANAAPPLVPARAASLPSVNSTTSANAGFSMPVTCIDNPYNARETPLRFTLRDANATGSTSNQLTTVAAGTTSAGVKLQLLRKDATGAYVVQNMGSSWDASAYRGTGMGAVDLAVRYIRTGAITPGTIRSQATLTIDYR